MKSQCRFLSCVFKLKLKTPTCFLYNDILRNSFLSIVGLVLFRYKKLQYYQRQIQVQCCHTLQGNYEGQDNWYVIIFRILLQNLNYMQAVLHFFFFLQLKVAQNVVVQYHVFKFFGQVLLLLPKIHGKGEQSQYDQVYIHMLHVHPCICMVYIIYAYNKSSWKIRC